MICKRCRVADIQESWAAYWHDVAKMPSYTSLPDWAQHVGSGRFGQWCQPCSTTEWEMHIMLGINQVASTYFDSCPGEQKADFQAALDATADRAEYLGSFVDDPDGGVP